MCNEVAWLKPTEDFVCCYRKLPWKVMPRPDDFPTLSRPLGSDAQDFISLLSILVEDMLT